jgi:hypothetical protein
MMTAIRQATYRKQRWISVQGVDSRAHLLGRVGSKQHQGLPDVANLGHDEVLRATTHALPELPTTKHPRPRSSSQHMGHIHGCTYSMRVCGVCERACVRGGGGGGDAALRAGLFHSPAVQTGR